MATDAKAATLHASKFARAAETDQETFKRMADELNEDYKKNPDYVREVVARAKFINSDDHWYIANLPELAATESNGQFIFEARPPRNPIAGNVDGIGRLIAETHENYNAAVVLSQVCQSGVTASEFEAHLPAGTDGPGVYKKGEILSMANRITELDNRVALSPSVPKDELKSSPAPDNPSLELPVIYVHGDVSDAPNLTATCDRSDTKLWSSAMWDWKYLRSKLPSFGR